MAIFLTCTEVAGVSTIRQWIDVRNGNTDEKTMLQTETLLISEEWVPPPNYHDWNYFSIMTMKDHAVISMDINSHGTKLVIGFCTGKLMFYDLILNCVICEHQVVHIGPESPFHDPAASRKLNCCEYFRSPSGCENLLVTMPREIQVWNSETATVLFSVQFEDRYMRDITIHPQGHLIIVNKRFLGTREIYCGETGEKLNAQLPDMRNSVFNHAGSEIAEFMNHKLLLKHGTTFQKIWLAKFGYEVTAAVFSTDDQHIAVLLHAFKISVRDAVTGIGLSEFDATHPRFPVKKFGYSGSLLISSNGDSLRLWESAEDYRHLADIIDSAHLWVPFPQMVVLL